ncbi:MAG: hypothetical protein AB8W37_11690 [Arsenophonus endosymbiont of Dermacentor nuttalli]
MLVCEIAPLLTQYVQLDKTAYTLASPLVVGRIFAGNNLHIKSNQLVNDKSAIYARVIFICTVKMLPPLVKNWVKNLSR